MSEHHSFRYDILAEYQARHCNMKVTQHNIHTFMSFLKLATWSTTFNKWRQYVSSFSCKSFLSASSLHTEYQFFLLKNDRKNTTELHMQLKW